MIKVRQTDKFELLLKQLLEESDSVHNLGGTPTSDGLVVIFGMRHLDQVSHLVKRKEDEWELSEWESIYDPEFDWTLIGPFFAYH